MCSRRKGKSFLNRNALAAGSKNYAGAAVETHATPSRGITSKRTRRRLALQCDCLSVAPRHEAQFASCLALCRITHTKEAHSSLRQASTAAKTTSLSAALLSNW